MFVLNYSLTVVVVLVCIIANCCAAPTNWQGVFSFPYYGNSIYVCVSEVSGTYYGQAVFSKLGYMRGTINSGTDQWTGNYYLAGIEAQQGTFSLSLTLANNNTFAGTFAAKGTGSEVFSVSGTQYSTESPTELECFRSDNNMLTTTVYYDMSGAWISNNVAEFPTYNIVSETQVLTSSYSYEYEDGLIVDGTGTGPVFENGQVVCYNWYEVGADEGIQITVAKNLTTAYSIWWFAKSVSTLNYEFTTVPDFFGQQYEYLDSSVSASELADEAVENACYALWTTDLEDDCLGEESNTSHGVTQELLIAILVFVCLILVSLIAFGLFGLIQLNKRLPLARAETTNNPITAVNATL